MVVWHMDIQVHNVAPADIAAPLVAPQKATPRFSIKKAGDKDFEVIFKFVQEMVAASVFHFAIPSRKRIAEHFYYPQTGTFIAYKDGVPIGFISACIAPFFFSDYERATDLGFYIRPDHRGGSTALRMLRVLEKWAKQNGAKYLQIGHSVGGKVDEMKSFYIRNGYKVGGFNSMKEL